MSAQKKAYASRFSSLSDSLSPTHPLIPIPLPLSPHVKSKDELERKGREEEKEEKEKNKKKNDLAPLTKPQ
jgi:hypothetical protein